MSEIKLIRLAEENFDQFEKLLCDSGEPGCYCSFWHGKWSSMEQWKTREKCEPLKNRETTLEKVRTGFHVGVLAYEGSDCVGWISVGPLMDFFWLWRRLAQIGEAEARITAGIMCINISPKFRGKGYQEKLLNALVLYGREIGWKTIEGYPFDDEAFKKHGLSLDWTGFASGYEKTGFKKMGPHWLSAPEYQRLIYQKSL